MSHPFAKIFEIALRKSTSDENRVLKEAERLIERGYSEHEVCGVLVQLEKSLLDESEEETVRNAREEVCVNLDDNDESDADED